MARGAVNARKLNIGKATVSGSCISAILAMRNGLIRQKHHGREDSKNYADPHS